MKISPEDASTAKHVPIDLSRDVQKTTVVAEDDGVPVTVRAHIESLHCLDMVNQTFEAKISIAFRWDIHYVGEIPLNDDIPCPLNFDEETFSTLLSTDLFKSFPLVAWPLSTNRAAVMKRIVIKGTFGEKFELHTFPFDIQTLNMSLTLWDPKTRIKGSLNPARLKLMAGDIAIIPENFFFSDVWCLGSNLRWQFGESDPKRSHCGDTYPIIVLQLELQRKPQFYIWSVMLPTFVFIAAAHSSLVSDVMELPDRLSITLTLLLTVVAMQFLITKPAISYLTYLDVYINTALLFMFAIIVENVLATVHFTGDSVHRFDKTFGLVCFSLWVVIHICIMVWYASLTTIPVVEMKTPTSFTSLLKAKDNFQW
jgi:hypothetical protein